MSEKIRVYPIAVLKSKANCIVKMLFLSFTIALLGCRQDNPTRSTQPIEIERLSTAEYKAQTQKGAMLLIDIRDQNAIRNQPFENASIIPLNALKTTLNDAPRNQRYVILGNSTYSGLNAAKQLQEMGFERLNYIDGDDAAWRTGGSTAN